MAGKINTRFVTLLAVAIVVCVVGAGAFYTLFVRKSNADLLAAGDKHLQLAQSAEQQSLASIGDEDAFAAARNESGVNYRLAAESYGVAYRRDRSNSDVLLKYLSARRKMTVESGAEAGRILKEVSGLTREATELRRNDDELLESYYQQLYHWGKTFGAPSFFSQILNLSSSKLESDPDNLVAIKFNRIARSLTLSESVDRDLQDEIREGLELVLTTMPDDTDAMHFLARWHLFDAKRLKRAQADPETVDAAVARARAFADRAFEIAPNNGQVAIEYLTILLDPVVGAIEVARPVLEGLESYLTTNPDPPSLVARVTRLLTAIERERIESDTPNALLTTGIRRSEEMLRKAAAQKPGVLMFRLLLAQNLKTQLRLDDAHTVYLAARDHQINGPFEEALRDESLRQQAIYEVANIELIRAEAATEPERRNQLLTQADEAIDVLETVTGESTQVLMLRGKTHLLRGTTAQAMIAIDKASTLYQDRNLEALLLSARARQAQQQWGAAAERLQQALTMMGNSAAIATAVNVRLQLAEMLIRMRDFDASENQLRRVLNTSEERLTDDKRATLKGQKQLATVLQARSMSGRGQTQEAIDLLENMEPGNRPATASRTLVALYQKAGQNDRSRALLSVLAAANPADLRLLQQQLTITPEADRAALLDNAEAAGADPAAIKLLRGALASTPDQDPGEQIEQAASEDATPLDLALAKTRAYNRRGEHEEARSYFEQARALGPDDDRVVIMGLDYAISDKDFDLAGTLVADAARRNLDLANGHLLRGKLAAAEGDLRQALASFELGLEDRPVFDEGWRQYGDLRLQNGEAEAAAAAYTRALDQRPNNLRAILGLARAQDRQGRRDGALNALRTAVEYAPNNTAVVEQYMAYEASHGRRERVLAMRKKIAEANPNNANNRLNLALLFARDEKIDDALAEVDAVEAARGVSRDTVGLRARVFGTAGRADQGVQVISAWVEGRGDQAEPADRMLLARYLVSVGQLDDAVTAYRAAAEASPGDQTVNSELADMLFNNNRAAESIDLYTELLASTDDTDRQRVGLRLAEAQLRIGSTEGATHTLDTLEIDATSEALRAVIALNAGDSQGALAMVNRAIERDPNNATTYLQRAQIQLQIPGGDAQLALDDLDRVLNDQPALVQALALKAQVLNSLQRPSDAAATLQILVDAQPGNPAAREMLAQALIASGDTNRAAYIVREGLRIAPDRAGLLQLDARLARSSGRSDAAEASLLKLIETQPDNANAVIQLAESYLNSGRNTDVETLLQTRPTMLNRFPILQAFRGRALITSKRSDEGRRVFGLALERADSPATAQQIVRQIAAALTPSETVALVEEVGGRANPLWTGLGLVNLDLGKGDFDAALDRLARLRPLAIAEPALAERIQRIEAVSFLQSGRLDEARGAYEAMLAQKPNDIEALNNLSFMLLTSLDDPAAALPLAERAAQLAGRNANVLDTYGVALQRVGRLEDARVQLEASVALAAQPGNLLHLGELYAELTFTGRARTQLDQAIDAAKAAGDEETALRAQRALDRLTDR